MSTEGETRSDISEERRSALQAILEIYQNVTTTAIGAKIGASAP